MSENDVILGVIMMFKNGLKGQGKFHHYRVL
jgi:hypothetical protein